MPATHRDFNVPARPADHDLARSVTAFRAISARM
jgi:hypothetical protein